MENVEFCTSAAIISAFIGSHVSLSHHLLSLLLLKVYKGLTVRLETVFLMGIVPTPFWYVIGWLYGHVCHTLLLLCRWIIRIAFRLAIVARFVRPLYWQFILG